MRVSGNRAGQIPYEQSVAPPTCRHDDVRLNLAGHRPVAMADCHGLGRAIPEQERTAPTGRSATSIAIRAACSLRYRYIS